MLSSICLIVSGEVLVMYLRNFVEVIAYFVILLAITAPLGRYLKKVFTGERTILSPVFQPFENLIFISARIDPKRGMNWKGYGTTMLVFSMLSLAVSYLLLRLQGYLPLNPQGFGGNEMTPDLAFNTASSFSTNTNWQSYSPELTLSYFSNMVSLAIHNWISAAVGLCIAVVVVRGFALSEAKEVGNFWADLVRGSIYVLFPMALISALIFLSQGVPQTFDAAREVTTLEGAKQIISLGPVASQEAIKQLGTNGGGFFNANSAHPFENPSPASNLLSMILMLSIPAGLTSMFGIMVGDKRQGWAIFGAMSALFLLGALACGVLEQQGTPHLSMLGINQAGSNLEPGGNMEGKELRFGIASSTLFATTTTAASCGAVNSMHDSYTPLGGLIPLFNMLTGEVIFGGVGSGLYGMLVYAVLAVFIAGLMVGRTPEYIGKKVGSYEVKMAMLALLVLAATILVLTCLSLNLDFSITSPWNRVGTSNTFLGNTRNNLNNSGPHGFTEVLYAFASATGNNGSAFAGLTANTPYFNIAIGMALLIGRFFMIVPLLAMAGSFAERKRVPPSLGTFPTDGLTFVVLLVGVVLIIGALTFLPALALGPIAEYFQMNKLLLQ